MAEVAQLWWPLRFMLRVSSHCVNLWPLCVDDSEIISEQCGYKVCKLFSSCRWMFVGWFTLHRSFCPSVKITSLYYNRIIWYLLCAVIIIIHCCCSQFISINSQIDWQRIKWTKLIFSLFVLKQLNLIIYLKKWFMEG